MRKSVLAVFVGAALFSTSSFALEATVNGFGTAGYAVNNTSKAVFKNAISDTNNKGYLTDSLLGVQMDAKVSPNLSLTGQVLVAQSLDNTAQMAARTEWLFLGYRLDNQTRIRAGKLRLPAYMLSEKLEVGHAYPWVRPPVEMYGQLPTNNFDGVDLTYRTEMGDTEVMLQPFFGYSTFNASGLDLTDPNRNFGLELNNIVGLNITAAPSDDLKLRIGHFAADVRGTGTPTNAIQVAPGVYRNALDLAYGSGTGLQPNDLSKIINFSGTFTSAGMQYKMGNTMLMVEAAKREIPTSIYEGTLGGYVSLAHKIGHWTPFVYYATANGEANKDKRGGVLKYQQSTWATGINYDLSPTSKLKLQVENTKIGEDRAAPTGYSPIIQNDRLKDLDVMMYTITYDFLF